MTNRFGLTVSIFHRTHFIVWLLLAGIILSLLWTRQLPEDFILSEAGPIEMISAASYLLCDLAVVLVAASVGGKNEHYQNQVLSRPQGADE
jgi:multisubunit Na+/H+ antiporter MnhB subunit